MPIPSFPRDIGKEVQKAVQEQPAFLPAAKPRRSMDDVWPPSSYDDLEKVAFGGQRDMGT